MSYVYVVTLWVHTGDTNTQPGSGDTWSHVMTAASPTHVTWAAGAGPGRLLPASAWWSESLSAPYTTLPSGWPGHSEALHRARHQHHHSTGQHTSTSTNTHQPRPLPHCLHCPHFRSSSSQLTFSSETSRDLRLLPTTLSSSSSSTILDSPVSALSSARSRSASTMASFLATWAAAR